MTLIEFLKSKNAVCLVPSPGAECALTCHEYDYCACDLADAWRASKVSVFSKRAEILTYCEPHLDQMWAAKIAGIILDCDFRDVKSKLTNRKEKP